MQEAAAFLREHFQREKEKKRLGYRQMNRYARRGQTLMTGSSLMEQFPVTEFSMNEGLGIVYNRGIGGYTTDEFLEAVDDVLLDLEPSKLFINIGTNDIRKWPDEDWYTHLKRNYGKICGIIRDRLGSAQVYMLAYYPVNPFVPGARKNPGLEVRTPEALERANGLVRELAEAYGFRYLDVNDGLKDERGCLKEEYTSDGMHFEPELYYTVFERLRPYLKQA